MHSFLFVRLLHFYAGALGKDPLKPLVIHRDKSVLDIDEAAKERLVYPGMRLTEAKAILSEAKFVAWEEEPFRSAQKQWLDLCTEFSDVIEPSEEHSAWIDLSLHPDPVATTFRLVQKIEQEVGLKGMVGLGCSKWIATIASNLMESRSQSIAEIIRMWEPVSRPGCFLAPLKTRWLTPVELEHRQRLEFLGYPTIGDVASVPLAVLRGQFGEAATHIRMCARGGYFEAVQAHYPPNSISDRLTFDGRVEDLQELDRGLRLLASRLGKRLADEDIQSKVLKVVLEHEEGEPTRLKRNFSKPIENIPSALASLRLLVESKKPITGIRVRLEEVIAASRVQRELSGRNTDRERGVKAAFQHVRTVFGDQAIQSGIDLVEPRRKQVLRAWKDATGWS